MRFDTIAGLYRIALAALMSFSTGFASAAEFPPMQANTVGGAALELPAEFAEGPSVVIMVYDQNQQDDADSWLPFLDEIAADRPSARSYVMPVLPAGLSMVRGMVEEVIRKSAKNSAQLDQTILLFTDIGALQAQLGISGTSAIHVLVLDDAGQVAATASGAYSPFNSTIVEDALAGLDGGDTSTTVDGSTVSTIAPSRPVAGSRYEGP